MRLKYDVKELNIESEYDTTSHVVNFMTLIQIPQYVYENIGNTCLTAGR